MITTLVAGLLPALMPLQTFAAFSDVNTSTESEAINALQGDGVLEGYADGTFRPNNSVNRAEFLKILLEARGVVSERQNCFPDVGTEWFAKYVCSAKDEGIVSGYPDGTFKPEQPISFVEASKILSLAYKQHTEGGSEWYEPYARALESAKAIPESIGALDVPLTRGEMAEMMWRVKDGITDKPSKGYMNVKYPELSVNLASDEPQEATKCLDLAAFSQEGGQGSYGGGIMFRDGVAAPSAEDVKTALPQAGGGDADHSLTNVQVQGVDEADVVKTDGTYLYSIRQSAQEIRIVKAAGGDLSDTATISFAGGTFSPSDLYVQGNRLVVMGTSWGGGRGDLMERNVDSKMMIYPPYWNPGQSVARIYDLSSPSKPRLARTVAFDGSMVSSRMIGDKLYMVMNQGIRYGIMPLANVKEADVLPSFTDSAKGDAAMPVARCGDVTILPHVPSPQYLTVGVIDTDSDNADIQRTVILGRGDTVYSSLENLYVATQDWHYAWDPKSGDTGSQTTRLYRFKLDNNGATFAARGEVDGRILNQFSMDENGNTFRIATTTDGNFTSNDRTNSLFILNSSDMREAGSLTDIAKGEQIYSVRFMGNRAYVVTFKTVDPLFVIDTSNPRSPKILGELKIPGYSNYLHPVDENHIIGFGKDVDESIDSELVHDPNAVYYTAVLGMKMAMFDVTDVAHPKEVSKEVIGDRGTESPLLYDHRALFYDAERKILAFPVSVMKTTQNPNPTGPWDKELSNQVFQGAYVYSFNTSSGFKLLGKATHYKDGDCQQNQSWTYCYGRDILRIARIGSTLFTVSDGGVQSNNISNVSTIDEIRWPLENGGGVVRPLMQE